MRPAGLQARRRLVRPGLAATTHVAKGKGIPPFLILHVADHPDTTAQAFRLGTVLKAAGVKTIVIGAKETQ